MKKKQTCKKLLSLLLALVIGVVSAVAGYLLVRYLLRTQLNLE